MRGMPHHSQCEMYVRNYSLLEGVPWEERWEYLADGGQEEATTPTQLCQAWEYDKSSFQSTLISEVRFVCGWGEGRKGWEL